MQLFVLKGIKRRWVMALFFGVVVFCAPGTLAGAEEYAVPNSGSPYLDMAELEENEILHLPTGTKVTVEQVIETISGSRVIYIGETHDNIEAHRVQAVILSRLAEKFPGKIAIGMEMFRRSAQPDLDRWHEDNLSNKAFKKLFRNNWGMGYKLYLPIFELAKERGLPIIGLKASSETESLLRDNPSHVEGLPELDASDPYHRAYAMSIFGGDKPHAKGLPKPYRMLLLWEESMAETVAEFLKNPQYADWKLVVLAGGFHVQYGYGIPKRAFRRAPHAYSIILPTVTEIPEELKDREMKVESVSTPLYAGDFGWKLQYKVLPKNKIKLGVRLKEDEKGINVSFIAENSNADQAGIMKGDILLALDGKNLEDVEDLIDRLQLKKFGDRFSVQVMRNGETVGLEGILQTPE